MSVPASVGLRHSDLAKPFHEVLVRLRFSDPNLFTVLRDDLGVDIVEDLRHLVSACARPPLN